MQWRTSLYIHHLNRIMNLIILRCSFVFPSTSVTLWRISFVTFSISKRVGIDILFHITFLPVASIDLYNVSLFSCIYKVLILMQNAIVKRMRKFYVVMVISLGDLWVFLIVLLISKFILDVFS